MTKKKKAAKKKAAKKKATKKKAAKKKTLNLEKWAEIFSEGIEI